MLKGQTQKKTRTLLSPETKKTLPKQAPRTQSTKPRRLAGPTEETDPEIGAACCLSEKSSCP